MEIDVELQLPITSKDAVARIAAKLVIGHEVENREHAGIVVVRTRNSVSETKDSNSALLDFLLGLRPAKEIIGEEGCTLCVGIFYDIAETVALPLRLSSECINEIGDFHLALDVTGYPCAEDQ